MRACSRGREQGHRHQPGAAQVLHQLQLLLLGSLHLRRRQEGLRPRVQEVRRRADLLGQDVQVHRHLPRHVRPTVQEELARHGLLS